MSLPTWFFAYPGVPAAELFASTGGLGSPIIVDSTTDTPYYLKAGVVTPFAGGGGGGAVSSVFGRTGAVVALPGDYTAADVGAAPSSHVGSSGVSQHAVATGSVAGFMSAADKTRFDGIFAGTVTATVPGPAGQFEHAEVIAVPGMLPADLITLSPAPTVDTDENGAETLEFLVLAGEAGTGQLTVRLAFPTLTSGPIRLNYMVM